MGYAWRKGVRFTHPTLFPICHRAVAPPTTKIQYIVGAGFKPDRPGGVAGLLNYWYYLTFVVLGVFSPPGLQYYQIISMDNFRTIIMTQETGDFSRMDTFYLVCIF